MLTHGGSVDTETRCSEYRGLPVRAGHTWHSAAQVKKALELETTLGL